MLQHGRRAWQRGFKGENAGMWQNYRALKPDGEQFPARTSRNKF